MTDPISRNALPIADRKFDGDVPFDAKDPAAKFPPIEPLRPPCRRAERARGAARRRRLRCVERLRRPLRDADRGPPRGRRLEVQPVSHDGPVLADPGGSAERTQPPHRRHGRDHRDRDLGAGLQLAAAQHLRSARRDAEAERLLDGAVRQVPRGAGLADEPDGAVRQLADGRGRVRVLLRLHRRRDEPVASGPLRGHVTDRARPHAGGGLPLHRGPDRIAR